MRGCVLQLSDQPRVALSSLLSPDSWGWRCSLGSRRAVPQGSLGAALGFQPLFLHQEGHWLRDREDLGIEPRWSNRTQPSACLATRGVLACGRPDCFVSAYCCGVNRALKLQRCADRALGRWCWTAQFSVLAVPGGLETHLPVCRRFTLLCYVHTCVPGQRLPAPGKVQSQAPPGDRLCLEACVQNSATQGTRGGARARTPGCVNSVSQSHRAHRHGTHGSP